MPVYTAVLTVNMVFEWHLSVKEMEFMFNLWMPTDFARAMDDGGPIASLWRVGQIKEIPGEQVDEALKAIDQRGDFDEDGCFISADDEAEES